MGVRRLVPTSALLALLVAAPAHAATVRTQDAPGKIRVEAAAGEINQVTVSADGDALKVSDTGGTPLVAGNGCTEVSKTEATCPLAGIRDVKVDLGDQPDTATVATAFGIEVKGGDGNDTLLGSDADDELLGEGGDDRITGAAGKDSVDGGEGGDTLLVRDGARDSIVCGGGEDAGEADLEDELAADCEKVERPLVPGSLDPNNPVAPADSGKPEPGRTVAVVAKRGHVFVVRPGGQSTPVDPTKPLPVGSVLDTTQGTVTLTSAANMSGDTQTADFTGGKFAIAQKPGPYMVTELKLSGGNFAKCNATTASRTTARAAASGKRIRRLWGSGHGRFTTRGRNSAATVRGTIWSVEDRCDGTLTRVERGVVVVKDFAKNRTKVVRKGETYFAAKKRAAKRR